MNNQRDISSLRFPSWFDMNRFDTYQRFVLEEIVERFDEGNDLVVLNCPTGGGKSALAEMTHQLLGGDGAYICTTKSLQHQFNAAYPESLIIMGRANYEPTHAEPDAWNNMPTCGDCDKRDTTLCSHCKYVDACPYPLAKERASECSLPVMNTAYFMGECSNGLQSRFSGRDLVIADECHLIEDEILRFVEVSISPRLQKWLDIAPPDKRTVASSWPAWFEYAIPYVKRKRKEIYGSHLTSNRRRQTLDRLVVRMTEVAQNLEGWIYDGYQYGAITFKPISVKELGTKTLFQHGKKWLAMSATVIPEHFVETTGFEGSWAPVFAPSVFPKERRPIYYCPSARMTKKTEETEWPKMAAALRVVLERHPEERVLVHTHSYGLTSFLADSLNGMARPVFTYLNSKDRQFAIQNYEETDNAVLLASSLETGYDGIDDKCRVIVVCKVPFASLGDKQVNARLRTTKDGEFWYAAQTGMAIMQGLGRGMRHEADSCTSYVLDEMFQEFFNRWAISRCECGHKVRTHDKNGCHFGDCDCIRDVSKLGDHKLFAPYILEALHWDSPTRFEVHQAVKSRLLNSVTTVN